MKLPTVEPSRPTRCEPATTIEGKMTKGSSALAGESVTLTEVRFDGVVCGIEVAPYVPGENETVSTTPIASYPSGSWSLSSHSVGVAHETKPLRPLDVNMEPPLVLYPAVVHTYSNGVCSPVYELECTRKRDRSRVDKASSEDQQVIGPIFFDSEDEDEEDAEKRSHSELLSQKVDSAALIPAVTLPKADLMINQMFSPKLPQPWNIPTKMLEVAPLSSLTEPAMLRDDDLTLANLTPSSTSPLLSAVHGKDQIQISLETFRHMVPKLLSDEKSPGALRVQLDNWRDSMKTLKQRMKEVTKEPLLISSRNGITCSASALPLITASSPHPSTASEQSLFEDKELSAIMDLTEGGTDTSILFPCVSAESRLDEDLDDDDGLGEELGALNTIEEDLRRELEATDMLVKSIVSSISESDESASKSSKSEDEDDITIEAKPLEGEDDSERREGGCKSLAPQGTKSTECDSSIEPEDLDGKFKDLVLVGEVENPVDGNDSLSSETRGPEFCSPADTEEAERKEWEALDILKSLEEAKSGSIEGSTDSVILYKATRSLDSSAPFDDEASSYAKSKDSYRPVSILRSTGRYSRPATRVRFKEQLEEFFSYDESCLEDEGDYGVCPDSESCQDATSTDLGDLQGAWEDFYVVCEELIDEVFLVCCKAADRQSYPSKQSIRPGPVKRSSVHYF